MRNLLAGFLGAFVFAVFVESSVTWSMAATSFKNHSTALACLNHAVYMFCYRSYSYATYPQVKKAIKLFFS